MKLYNQIDHYAVGLERHKMQKTVSKVHKYHLKNHEMCDIIKCGLLFGWQWLD